jgi:flavin reductase (DIM6/NTAB) family NADH-FMN oxidoreductase RutF
MTVPPDLPVDLPVDLSVDLPLDPGTGAGGPDVGTYRRAMGRLASGVTVVTTVVGGHEHAMTANAVTSVSLEPLLLLCCVEQEARFHDAVLEAGVWAVNILPASARADAEWLATRGRPLHGQLDRIPHRPGPATGAPLLTGALAGFECRTTDTYPGGDHTIVVGEVLAVTMADHGDPALLYYRGRYGTLA